MSLDPLGHELDPVRRALPHRFSQLVLLQCQQVELDDGHELQERVIVVAPDVVVKRQGVALEGQPSAACQDLLVPGDVLEDLDHDLLWGKGDLVLADEEGTGRVDKGQLVADQALQADVQASAHQDIGRHRVTARDGRARPLKSSS